MKTHAIVPANLTRAPDAAGSSAHVPHSANFDDIYHSASGAFEQAEHVFLRGNELPARWQARPRFVILETGFGLGNNFLATWAAWKRDPARCDRLIYISIEKHPLTQADLAGVHAQSPQPELAQALVDSWPPLTPNLHTLTFDGGHVQLLIGFGDIADLLPALAADVDAFYLDGFAPAKNPDMWSEHAFKRLARLATPGASAATWTVARSVRDALARVGFSVQRRPGFGSKRDMLTARFEPRYIPPKPPGMPRTPQGERRALIIGGGLAGCAAAWALAEQGWSSTVLDRNPSPASEASGNPAGLFHGIINADDGMHARLHRAAALTTAQLLKPWIKQERVRGQCQGLLRLEPRLGDAQASAILEKLGLPASFVTWLSQANAEQVSGLPVPCGGWLFGDGGWVSPRDYAQTLLKESGAQFTGGQIVACLSRENNRWCAWTADGLLIAAAPAVVIACGPTTERLLPQPEAAGIRLASSRGQVSWLPTETGYIHSPHIPVAGGGYVIPANGQLVFGATADLDDIDPALRMADHQENLDQAVGLGAVMPTAGLATDFAALTGRVGWRAVTPDRLPVIGPAALDIQDPAAARPKRVDHPRHYPRLQDDAGGLYVLGGLGSRGITWAALAGRILAAWVSGCPAPIETDLLYAMDPTRFVLKSHIP